MQAVVSQSEQAGGSRRRLVLSCLLLGLADVLALAALAAYALWAALPHFCGDAERELARQTPVRRYVDRHGEELLLEPTYDAQWRLPVPLARISPAVQKVMIGAEDGRFYSHDGVDRLAVLRSLWMNVRHGSVKSGASTITMQLAGLVLGRERTLSRKLRQAGMARRLEWRHSKAWILENYLNRILYGGKIYGIEAAARHYFGRSAAELNTGEAALLCGLPQRPNAFRPDRHPELALGRRKMVLTMLEENGLLAAGEAERILREEPVRLRDFRLPSPLRSQEWKRTDHLLAMARREARNSLTVAVSVEPWLQRQLEQALRQQQGRMRGVRDGAGVIIDNASGEVLALVGTLDFMAKPAGQVNVAICRRTAGSTLKPFIYAEAIDGGFICAETILSDAPLRFGNYAPGNYDGTYAGGVTAATALSRSLNTPAVRLVARLGVKRFLDRLQTLGLQRWKTWQDNAALATKLGLSVTLGTGGYRLLDLAGAYAALARGGTFVLPSCLHRAEEKSRAAVPVFTRGTAAMVTAMLSERPLEGGMAGVAWKTGTSTGNTDAWCLAYTTEYTVGIWFGNKDGSGAPALVGGTAAAPCAAAVLNAMYRDHVPAPFRTDDCLESVELCARTGLRAAVGCTVQAGQKAAGIPLRPCRQCGQPEKQRVCILKPQPECYIADGRRALRLPVAADRADVHWYLDDIHLGCLPRGARIDCRLGRHLLRAVSEEENILPGTVAFTVSERVK